MVDFNENRNNDRDSRPKIVLPRSGGFPKNDYSKGETDYNDPRDKVKVQFEKLNYDATWIINCANPTLVEFAEEAGKYMAKNGLTNSKIRNIYSEIIRIKMLGNFQINKSSFYLLKPKVAYANGREEQYKDGKLSKINSGLYMFKLIFDKAYDSIQSDLHYHNFCDLIEAILAYHKSNGGKD